MSLQRHKQDWEELAAVDPEWAILSAPERRYGRWTQEEFFATGAAEFAGVLAIAATLGYPRSWERALDFGCGLGRLTRAMAAHFQQCYGVDISEKMVQGARALNADRDNCTFVVNVAPHLGRFESRSFDFVYSNIVLQHLPRKAMARRYVAEFLRVVRPGGLVVFQLPHLIPWRNQVQLRRRLYTLLRRCGVSERYLYERAGLNPIRMIAISRPEMRRLIEAHGGAIAHIEEEAATRPIRSSCYYVRLR